jgi:p-aminobenzoyl-glutamate transporter AbgT
MIVATAPPSTLTAIVVTLGVLSSIASDVGYLVLIPLGAAAFYSLGRHPLAGLAAAFAGVAAAFGANFLVKPIDGILAEMTNDAIHIVDPSKSIDITSNFYFGAASSLLLIVVCTLISSRIVEPRLGKYESDSPPTVPLRDFVFQQALGHFQPHLDGKRRQGLPRQLQQGVHVQRQLHLLGLSHSLPLDPANLATLPATAGL